MKLTAKDNFYNTFKSFDMKDTNYLVGRTNIHQVNLKQNKTAHLENLGISFADPASSDEEGEYYDEEEDAEAEEKKWKPLYYIINL
mgnify:CR=1 FL=1